MSVTAKNNQDRNSRRARNLPECGIAETQTLENPGAVNPPGGGYRFSLPRYVNQKPPPEITPRETHTAPGSQY